MAQRDGTIRRETGFPPERAELVVSGPHSAVGNPLNKTPRRQCNKISDYDCLDLTTLPDDYMSRTNYTPPATWPSTVPIHRESLGHRTTRLNLGR